MSDSLQKAADCITQADAILIGAGAGMGVDSGLPDFRGDDGFWKAYPPMRDLGLSFYNLANPVWFTEDPQRAWGFYGHRRNLYRATNPHAGFKILNNWIQQKRFGGFVFTSNVDGHFQKSGFDVDNIVECHGSINFDQCVSVCCDEIWGSDLQEIPVEMNSFRASLCLPQCMHCSQSARPNVLMFGDYSWISRRTDSQFDRYESWLSSIESENLVIVEIGAGTAVPTVRHHCEQLARRFEAELIRINPRESFGRDAISVASGALDALQKIDDFL